MNREEIIKMALECGFNEFTDGLRDDGSRDTYLDCWPEQLERFFHMAQAAMVEQGWRKCAEGQRTTQFCGMTEKAVQEEREKVAEEMFDMCKEGWWDSEGMRLHWSKRGQA